MHNGFLDRSKQLVIRRGNLPHWRQEEGLYFVTFRLSDSLPQEKLRQLSEELRETSPWERARSKERVNRLHRWLDRGYGSCLLDDPAAVRIVENAVAHFDRERYELGELVVAANHVHVVVRTGLGHDLSNVVGSWKRHSAKELRKLSHVEEAMRGSKHIWQVESFDHLVRSQESLDGIVAYIKGHSARRG